MYKIFALALALGLCACAQKYANKEWRRIDGKPVGEIAAQELKECQYEAKKFAKQGTDSDAVVRGVQTIDNENELAIQCMDLRGYALVDRGR